MKFINALSISLRNEFIICRNMQLIKKCTQRFCIFFCKFVLPQHFLLLFVLKFPWVNFYISDIFVCCQNLSWEIVVATIAKFIKARYLRIIVKKSVTAVFQPFCQMRTYLKIYQFDHITHRSKKK